MIFDPLSKASFTSFQKTQLGSLSVYCQKSAKLYLLAFLFPFGNQFPQKLLNKTFPIFPIFQKNNTDSPGRTLAQGKKCGFNFLWAKSLDELWIRIEAEVLDGKNKVKISVTDSGKGIPLALHAQIFENFYTTKPKGQGTGLVFNNFGRNT